jgi:hypothetical protein
MWTLKGIIMSKKWEYREGNNIPYWRREQDHQFHAHELLKVYSEDSWTNPGSLYPYSVCCWHSTDWKAKMEDCPCPNHWSRTNWRSASPLQKSHEPHHRNCWVPPHFVSPSKSIYKVIDTAAKISCLWRFVRDNTEDEKKEEEHRNSPTHLHAEFNIQACNLTSHGQ